MRFASLGGSNAGNYAAAGKAVADSSAKVFDVQRKTGPDYAELSKVAMKTQAAEKIVGMQTAAQVTKQGIQNLEDKTKMQHALAVYDNKKDIKSKQRKAGFIAGLGKLGGAAFLASRKDDRELPTNSDAKNKVLQESIAAQRGILDRMDANDKEGLKAGDDLIDSNTNSTSNTSTGGNSSGKGVSGGSSDTTTLTGKGSSGTDPLSGLTSKDFDDMAYTISSEAALGTDDVYGVAANLVTRLRSGKYGNSIHAISHAPGQYEGVYTGRSVASPKISAQLQSPEGRARIVEAFNRLDGRTEFKGQTMLGNRVKSEDPMFDPKGNFYHYAGQ